MRLLNKLTEKSPFLLGLFMTRGLLNIIIQILVPTTLKFCCQAFFFPLFCFFLIQNG